MKKYLFSILAILLTVVSVAYAQPQPFFDPTAVDHTTIQNIGVNSHPTVDTHLADGTLHFTESSIDHGNTTGLLDNDHTQYGLLSGNNTWVGTNEFQRQLFINGTADEIQQLVQGHSTQTAMLAVWEDSAGNDQVTISVDGAVVINEEGNDADTRIESDNNPNMVCVDASTDRMGIGTCTPETIVHIFRDSATENPAITFESTGGSLPSKWSFNINRNTGRFTFRDETNSKDIFKIQPNTNTNLLRLGLDVSTSAMVDVASVGSSVDVAHLEISGGLIVNEVGGDNDFRVEGDTDPNLLVADAGLDAVGVGGVARAEDLLTVHGSIGSAGANGSFIGLKSASELISGLSGASVEGADSFIPHGVVVLGFSARITTTITGPTSIDIGWIRDDDAGLDPNAFAGTFSPLTAGTTTANAEWTVSATLAGSLYSLNFPRKIRITANGGNFTAGAIRVVVWYFESTAPTS